MRSVRKIQSLFALATPMLGAIFLFLQTGCVGEDNKARFYTYCDQAGCYECGPTGCTGLAGRPPGASCKTANECAPGCFCAPDNTCSEAGFCDRVGDCARGYTCNVARHSCEPDKAPGTVTPRAAAYSSTAVLVTSVSMRSASLLPWTLTTVFSIASVETVDSA